MSPRGQRLVTLHPKVDVPLRLWDRPSLEPVLYYFNGDLDLVGKGMGFRGTRRVLGSVKSLVSSVERTVRD